MKSLFLSCCVIFVSSVTSAQTPTPILTAIQHSGFVPPQYRFAVNCALTTDGKLHSEVSSMQNHQWGVHEIVDRTLSSEELAAINLQIQESSAGPFQYSQNPCDIGTFSVMAQIGAVPFAILNSEDCGARTTNQSESAKKVLEWARKECKLR